MIHFAAILFLTLCLFALIRRGLIQVDMSFSWLVAIILLGFFSTSKGFVNLIATWLGILYPPIAIVFLTIFVIFALITVLLIGLTRLRDRQIKIVRHMAATDLARQEQAKQSRPIGNGTDTAP
jgi:hypothetical protein